MKTAQAIISYEQDYLKGKKTPKEIKTIAIKLLKAPSFHLLNLMALLVCF